MPPYLEDPEEIYTNLQNSLATFVNAANSNSALPANALSDYNNAKQAYTSFLSEQKTNGLHLPQQMKHF